MVFSKTHAYSSNINTDKEGQPSDIRRVLNCSRGDNWSWLEDGFCAPSLEATLSDSPIMMDCLRPTVSGAKAESSIESENPHAILFASPTTIHCTFSRLHRKLGTHAGQVAVFASFPPCFDQWLDTKGRPAWIDTLSTWKKNPNYRSSLCQMDQTLVNGLSHRGGAAGNVKLLKQTLDVGLHRPFSNPKFVPDGLVAVAFSNEL